MARRAAPKVGDRFVATAGPIAGSVVEVVEVVPPDVAGASAFLADAPLEDLRAARERERGELNALLGDHAQERTDFRGDDEAREEMLERHRLEAEELRSAHGEAAAEREAPWQDTAVVVAWDEPAMVIDTDVEPDLVPILDDAGEAVVRPDGAPATRAVHRLKAGTVTRRWSASASAFRDYFQEA